MRPEAIDEGVDPIPILKTLASVEEDFHLTWTKKRGAAQEMARAQVGTIRLKLFKVAARVVVSVRRVVFHLASSYPFQAVFREVSRRVWGVSPDISSASRMRPGIISNRYCSVFRAGLSRLPALRRDTPLTPKRGPRSQRVFATAQPPPAASRPGGRSVARTPSETPPGTGSCSTGGTPPAAP